LNRQSNLATIHILKKEANLDDVAYRNLLQSHAGVRSAADIASAAGFARVIDALLVLNEKKKMQVIPKPKIQIDFGIFAPSEPVPWTWYDATPEQWAKQGELISLADKKGWSMVAVWGADNTKKFKMRYK